MPFCCNLQGADLPQGGVEALVQRRLKRRSIMRGYRGSLPRTKPFTFILALCRRCCSSVGTGQAGGRHPAWGIGWGSGAGSGGRSRSVRPPGALRNPRSLYTGGSVFVPLPRLAAFALIERRTAFGPPTAKATRTPPH